MKNWDLHGVSWFSCRFADEEKKAERIIYSDTVTLKGSLEQVYAYCERELIHFLACHRLQRVQRELQRMESQLRGAAASAPEAVALAADADADDLAHAPELPALLADLAQPLLSIVAPLLSFLHECHGILRSSYIFLCLHYTKFDSSVHPSQRSAAANKLIEMLNQFEYFTDALDQTLIPAPNVARTMRNMEQMSDTRRYVRKYAAAFSTTLQFFQATELKNEQEEETTKAFFAALDAAAAPAGTGKR